MNELNFAAWCLLFAGVLLLFSREGPVKAAGLLLMGAGLALVGSAVAGAAIIVGAAAIVLWSWLLPRMVHSDGESEAKAAAEPEAEDLQTAEPIRCLQCGAIIPSQAAKCAQCGWSYNSP